MKKRDLYVSMQSLNSVSELKGVKFAYAVLKNKRKIEEEIKLFEEIIKPNPEFEEYEKKRIALCEVHSEKDTEGRPVIVGDKYKLVDVDLFNSALEILKTSYNDIIEERIRQINEYNVILDENIDISFEKINFIDIPINISAKELESIEFMVNME